jgi:phospholipid transport system substrate-binding protein
VLVKRISTDVIDTAKADKDIQAGNQPQDHGPGQRQDPAVRRFQRMTAQAAGRFWRQATPEQQKQLSGIPHLLIYTYSGALSQIKNETVEFKPSAPIRPTPKSKCVRRST